MGRKGKEVTEDPPAAKAHVKRTAASSEWSPTSSKMGSTLGSPDGSQASAATSSQVFMQILKKSKSALLAIEQEEGTKTERVTSARHHHGTATGTVSNTTTSHLLLTEHDNDFVKMSKSLPSQRELLPSKSEQDARQELT